MMKSFFFALLVSAAAIGAIVASEAEPLENFFIKIGTYPEQNCTEENNCKTYYLSKEIKAHWNEANQFCRLFGMELLKLETKDEETKLFTKLNGFTDVMSPLNHINGITSVKRSQTDWYLMEPLKKINYTLNFASGFPNGQLDGIPECLSINKGASGYGITFDDLPCFDQLERLKFFCQKTKKVDVAESIGLVNDKLNSQKTELEILKSDVQECQKKVVPDPIIAINEKLNAQKVAFDNLNSTVIELKKTASSQPSCCADNNGNLKSQQIEIDSLKAAVKKLQTTKIPDPTVAINKKLNIQRMEIVKLTSLVKNLQNSLNGEEASSHESCE